MTREVSKEFVVASKIISIIIPTLNEIEGIKNVLKRIPVKEILEMGYTYEIIVVDGGSVDGTDKVAKAMGAEVITELRRGYGRAYKTGFANSKGDIIITLDGDGSYPPEIIPSLLKLFINLDLDFIIAQRITYERSMSLINKLGNHILTLLTKFLFRINIKDSQSGMWLIRKTIIKDILPQSDGMEFSEEIKIKAFLCKKRIIEVPIPYYKRIGKPKLRRLQDGLKNLIYLFIIFIHSRMGHTCYR